jgi:hypothetical protein
MSVWVLFPSARPVEQVAARLAKWRQNGYNTAVLCSTLPPHNVLGADLYAGEVETFGGYPGYAIAQNWLIRWAMDTDKRADWFVCAADDIDPEPARTAEGIARECNGHFSIQEFVEPPCDQSLVTKAQTFGVMQPTGDRWGDAQGSYVERVAGSPWIGREFARRAYMGQGPYWPAYTHMGVDEELQAVAQMYGVFWQRPDLSHYHDHWGRPRPGETMGLRSRMPAFLEKANTAEEWNRYKQIFATRKAARFPGSELLP